MRENRRQRYHCSACGWTGGRAAGQATTVAPCSKCGGAVVELGPVYTEERVLAGCPSCCWWGERSPARVGQSCPKCGFGITEAVRVVTVQGQVLA